MEHYAGIDVSLELSSVCVVDAKGKIVKEAKVASDPEALVLFFTGLGFVVERIGIEAGPLSQWLHAGLAKAGFETVLLETRHMKAASLRHDSEDRSQGCARRSAAHQNGLVPSCALQVHGLAGSAGVAGGA
jgi:transposase